MTPRREVHTKARSHEGKIGGLSDAIEGVASEIVDSAFLIHNDLGPGLLESVYEQVLAVSLSDLGFKVQRQVAVPLTYGTLSLPEAFRADLLVEDSIVIEIKASERLERVHARQTLTYVRLLGLQLGFLINFGGERLKLNIHRVIDDHHSK
jgi:iron complex transport system substrate-binding protein